MLVLFETAAGYALFTVKNDGKLQDVKNLHKEFESIEKAKKVVKLKAFSKFENTADALGAATAVADGKLSKGLRHFLKEHVVSKEVQDSLAVAETKLGGLIKEKLGIQCVHDASIDELFRGIRGQLTNLISGLPENEMNAMVLGLSHSLSRYKLKFSPDKVDTMIIQAIEKPAQFVAGMSFGRGMPLSWRAGPALLDDLDKELNTYSMRVKEWYGWHFPELTKVIVDNIAFAKVVKAIGMRSNAADADLTEVLPEELETEVKELAEISMGTEISEDDLDNITHLCDQVISISEYRSQLYDYLKNRMMAIAPNLTTMVGELVGARLIAHAGSLMNLAKHPASTVQILGAEKALFRALKTKHDTPKYGLIYHASLIGQAAPKNKGKISRVLAAKAALAIRVDALGDKDTAEIGTENRLKVEERLRQIEGKARLTLSGSGKGKPATPKYKAPSQPVPSYNTAADSTLPSGKKSKKERATDASEAGPAAPTTPISEGKKASKKAREVVDDAVAEAPVSTGKKRKVHLEQATGGDDAVEASPAAAGEGSKKKKKAKHHDAED